MVPPGRPTSNEDPRARLATASDVLKGNKMSGLSINVGDLIGPSGLYCSDHDMFAFLVNEDVGVEVNGKTLHRGFFVENSEVGASSFKLTVFYYNAVCGNHIVWGATNVKKARVVHRGRSDTAVWKAQEQFFENVNNFKDNESIKSDQALFNDAVGWNLGNSQEEVVEFLYSKKIAPRNVLNDAYSKATVHYNDGHKDPGTVWGMVQGLTRLSQQTKHTDARVKLDVAATKVLRIAK